MLALKEFRTTAYGLPDLLPWAALVDDGIVLTKAGAFLAAWDYRGPDLDSATPEELRAMAARLNAALKLGDGWVLHCDAVRAPAPGYAPQGAFPDRTTRLIDDLRRAAHEGTAVGYASRYVLTVTWFPMPDAASRAADLFVDGRIKATASRNLERFQEQIRELEGRLSSLLHIRRLTDRVDARSGTVSSPLLAHLEQCVSLSPARRAVVMPEVPMYLDAILGHHDFATGFVPRVGRRHLACIAVGQAAGGTTGLPSYSFPGILDVLSRLPLSYRWSNRFIALDPGQAETVLNRYRSKWAMKRKSMLNLLRENAGGQATHINADADRMAADAVQALAEASSGMVRYGYFTSVLLLAHEDAEILDEMVREVAKWIENQGFGARIEEVNAVEAYLGSMPGNTAANVRRPLIHTLNLAHLLPFTAVWAGPDKNPCPFYPPDSPPLLYAKTDGATPFRLTLHAGDVGHTVILGPTGSGKSTLLATLVAQHFRYPKAQVFAFDKGYSLLPLCWGAGGRHDDIGGEHDDLAFCPLGRVHEPGEQVWAAEWLEQLCELQGLTILPQHRQEIYRAVVQLGQSTDQQRQRTLTHLLALVQDQTLRDALQAYTLRGMAGHLLDAEVDGLAEDPFQVFEMEHLLHKGDKLVLPVLSYLFHRIEQRLAGQPTLLVLDEAWILLGHPVFKAKIREWLKVLRKVNTAVVFATQSLSDLTQSGIADVIVESCPTKILLPNPEAQTENVRPAYEGIGLNRRQIEILALATPKRQYYVMHPDGRRLFELGLSDPELAFVGVSGKEDLARIRALRSQLGDAWPAQWLRERGQHQAAQHWESYR
ncbi:Conjugal transfer protein TrbE [Thiomonas sp. X19]|uniref:VirB4 family type IV secretion/conjugal transfer ATPase n=1 Tax=Thiomonas sp. X19 TaxID=1050370 RepID=UPI000B6ABFD9|nr:transporter [Thiomonas sp. X19]SCC93193.1 Conjugal transfer protein TrbE [Thiomonas sp. X19]